MRFLDFAKYNRLYLSITLITTVVSFALISYFGLNFGIDFSGGSVIDYSFAATPEKEEIVDFLISEKYEVSKVVVSEGSRVTIYLEQLSEGQVNDLDQKIIERYGQDTSRISVQTVGPSVGKETTKKSITSVAIAALAIVLYLTIAFRKVPKPTTSVEFGIAVILAMLHDVLIVLAAFAVLGKYFNAQVDALFITAILTVIGFSIHDSIVVFDRIRENLLRNRNGDYASIVNSSLSETLARSLNLSITVLFTLFALFVLGSESIRWFIAALTIGMISGTYSSIFVATQLLILMHNIKVKFRRV